MLGRILGKKVGARGWDMSVVKELFYYAYQCTECRRCSLYCPYGIDTAEITMIVRELLHEVGLGIHWIMDPVQELQLHRQPSGHPAPLFCGNRGNAGRRLRNRYRHPTQDAL